MNVILYCTLTKEFPSYYIDSDEFTLVPPNKEHGYNYMETIDISNTLEMETNTVSSGT